MKLTWHLSLRLNDGRTAAGKYQQSSTACPCGHCWCGKTGTGADVKVVWEQFVLSMVQHLTFAEEPDLPIPSSSAGPSSNAVAADQLVTNVEKQQPLITQGLVTEAGQTPTSSEAASNLPKELPRKKPLTLKRKQLAFRKFLSKYRRTHSLTVPVQTSRDLQLTSTSNPAEADQPASQLTAENVAALSEPETAGPTSSSSIPHNPDTTMDSERSFRVHVAHYYRKRRRAANLSFLNSSITSVSSFCFKKPPTTRVRTPRYQQHRRPPTPFVDQRVYECGECPRTYVQWANLQVHKLRTHQTNIRFQCEECPRSFDTRRGLSVHNGKIHPKRYNDEPSVVEDSHFESVTSNLTLDLLSEDEEEEDEESGAPSQAQNNQNTLVELATSSTEIATSLQASPPPQPTTNSTQGPNQTPTSGSSSSFRNKMQSPAVSSSSIDNNDQLSIQSVESNNPDLPRKSVLNDSEALNSGPIVITLDETSSSTGSGSPPCSSRYHDTPTCNHAKAEKPPFFKVPGLACRYCSLTFKEKSALTAHEVSMHNHGQPVQFEVPGPPLFPMTHNLKCRFCPLIFTSPLELRSHGNMHLNRRSSWGENALNTRRGGRSDEPSFPKESAGEPVAKSSRQSLSGSLSCLDEGPKYTSFSSVQQQVTAPQGSAASVSILGLPPLRCTPPAAHSLQTTKRNSQKERRFCCPYCPARMERHRHLANHIKRNHSHQQMNNISTRGNVSAMESFRPSNWRR